MIYTYSTVYKKNKEIRKQHESFEKKSKHYDDINQQTFAFYDCIAHPLYYLR